MEVNNTTSTGSPHTPILAVDKGGVIPPPSPSPTRNVSNQTPTTSSSGTISTTTTTIVPTIHNMYGSPFTCGRLSFYSSSNLTYSTLYIVGLGEGISNSPLK
jgi:hypothetical protein